MDVRINFLKTQVRECCVRHLTLRQIESAFKDAGFNKNPDYIPPESGERRVMVEQYYAGEDWDKTATIRKLLNVIELMLLLHFLPDDEKEKLRTDCVNTGFFIDPNGHALHMTPRADGVGHELKNLIFAADGPKPKIVLSDAISNEIEITENAEYCLVYNYPLQSHGLLWTEMCSWWRDRNADHITGDYGISTNLYQRLYKSLNSKPEQIFFREYFRQFYHDLGERLPGLIPQVYLHYDPYTVKQLKGKSRFLYQRMDFLLLLSEKKRVVIEIDGKHHYAENDIASPKLYANMVAEDRKLQLSGYEVYRFGAYEILDEAKVGQIIKSFFEGLFHKHHIKI
jgi:very-short-patch-repair endonuclease